MALSELQQPAKADFYQSIKNLASTVYNTMNQLERAAEFLARMDAATLDSMGVPASGADEGLRADLVEMRTVCNELKAFFDGTATSQTQVPKTVVNKLRSM